MTRITVIVIASLALAGCWKTGSTTDVSLTAFKTLSFEYKEDSEFYIERGSVTIDGVKSFIPDEVSPATFVCNPGDTLETITEIREHNAAYEALEKISR